MSNENIILSYRQIRGKIKDLSDKIKVEKQYLPLIGKIGVMGEASILVEENTYKYLYGERGHVYNVVTTTDFGEILYLSFKDITWQMSLEYEIKNRDNNQDSRRLYFKEQECLMKTLNENWGDRIHNELTEILAKHLFDDYVNVRLGCYERLCSKGHPPDDAWKLAVRKFKLP